MELQSDGKFVAIERSWAGKLCRLKAILVVLKACTETACSYVANIAAFCEVTNTKTNKYIAKLGQG